MVVPQAGSSTGLQGAHLVATGIGGSGQAVSLSSGQAVNVSQLIVQSQGHDASSRLELQMSRSPLKSQVTPPVLAVTTSPRLTGAPTTSASASGGTIHHLGQSPPRGAGGNPRSTSLQPLANPVQQHIAVMNTGNQQQQQGSLLPQQQGQKQQAQGLLSPQLGQSLAVQLQASTATNAQQLQSRRLSQTASSLSSSPVVNPAAVRQSTTSFTGVLTSGGQQNPGVKITTNPGVQSPDRPPRKKIKLEQRPPATEEIAHYRKLICDEKLREMTRIKETYHDHLTELFFLQNGGNLMDYFVWMKKPPSLHLQNMLKSGRLDSDEEDDGPDGQTEVNFLQKSYVANIQLLY